MKKLSVLLMIAIACFSHFCYAVSYKIKEYNDEGRIRITFKHIPKEENEEKKYELVSVSSEDIDALTIIRRSPGVVDHYANHTCPKIEDVESAFNNTFLSRVGAVNSLFPFVLKEVSKISGEVEQKSCKTLGFFNVGNGFTTNDRMYGYYMDPDFHGKGIGSVAINVCTHFVMQFHQNASGTLTVQQNKDQEDIINIGKTRFPGVLCATCDPDNPRSYQPLIKAGLTEILPEGIEERGYSEKIKSKIQVSNRNGDIVMQDTVKRYLELTWANFNLNEENGLYK